MPTRRLAAAFLIVLFAGCTVESPPPPLSAAPRPAPQASTPAPAPALDKPADIAAKARPKASGGGPPPLLARPKTTEPVSRLLEKAQRAASTGNFPATLSALEDTLNADPKNRVALRMLGEVTQLQASEFQRPQNSPLFLKSAAAFRKLVEFYPDLRPEEKRLLPQALYNEACTLALNGETDRAFKALVESFSSGSIKVEQLDLDAELDSLRQLPEFQGFQRQVERKNVEAILAKSRTKGFPFDFRLPDLEGKRIALADFKGTWCVPCRKQLPHLVEIYKHYHEKGLEIVGLTYEKEDDASARTAIRAFVKEHGIPYPCLLGDEATQQQVPEFNGYPTTLFVDREGKVRVLFPGYQSMVALDVAVNALLEEAKTAQAAAK
jgi:thiol-disulfide isomerase/thioredoxin